MSSLNDITAGMRKEAWALGDDAVRIAHRSTQGNGRFIKTKWVELSVWYNPSPAEGMYRFVALATVQEARKGATSVTGLASDGLRLALAHFEDTPPARFVITMAQEWAEQNRVDIRRQARPAAAMAARTYTEAQRDAALDFILDYGRECQVHGDNAMTSAASVMEEVAEALGLTLVADHG